MSISRRVLRSALIIAILGAGSFALVSIQCADAQFFGNPNVFGEDGGKNKGDQDEKANITRLLTVFQQQNFLKQQELLRQQQGPASFGSPSSSAAPAPAAPAPAVQQGP